jgi:hypothetical protein
MSKIRKPHELNVQVASKTLLYGQPGIGKTTLALSSPDPLLLDFDKGLHRVDPRHLSPAVQVESWDDVLDVLSEDLSEFKTLVIDTAGKMLDFMSAYLIKTDPKLGKRDGSLTLQGYGARKTMFVNFLSRVSNLGMHLIFVAHEREEKNGDEKILRPEIGGSSSGDLIKELDLVGYMEAHGKQRTISFDPCEKFYAKNTCKLEAVIKLPDVDKQPNNLMSQIISGYQQSLRDRQKMANDYSEFLDFAKDQVDSIVDAESANEVVEWAKHCQTHIWDSKLQTSRMIKAKAVELGLTFDREKGAYTDPVKQEKKVSNKKPSIKEPANAS